MLILQYADAFKTAVTLAGFIFLGSIALGSILFYISDSGYKIAAALVSTYVQVLRNIPVLVPIYLTYFGLPMLGLVWSASVCGCLAIILQQSAYISEILRGAAKSIDRNIYDAARSIGLSRWKTFKLITVPLVLVAALPALGNQTVLMFKDTSLLSAIAVVEVMFQAKILVEGSGALYSPFIVAATIYLGMALIIDLAFKIGSRSIRWTK